MDIKFQKFINSDYFKQKQGELSELSQKVSKVLRQTKFYIKTDFAGGSYWFLEMPAINDKKVLDTIISFVKSESKQVFKLELARCVYKLYHTIQNDFQKNFSKEYEELKAIPLNFANPAFKEEYEIAAKYSFTGSVLTALKNCLEKCKKECNLSQPISIKEKLLPTDKSKLWDADKEYNIIFECVKKNEKNKVGEK